MTDTLTTDARDLLRRHAEGVLLARRMAALKDPAMRLRERDAWFVGDICFRKPETLTARQAAMVELLCWRHRDQVAALANHPYPDLVPAKEPKLPARTERPERHDAPLRRQRGPRA